MGISGRALGKKRWMYRSAKISAGMREGREE
jgi:hypothetical protein